MYDDVVQNPPPALTLDTFDTLFAQCLPKPQAERWTEIAWETELWPARQRSAQENKPLFLWAMNGHPIGCV